MFNAATVKIQSVFRGFQTRKNVEVKKNASIESVSKALIPPYPTVSSDSSNKNKLAMGTSNSNFKSAAKKETTDLKSSNQKVSSQARNQSTAKSPLRARSSKLKQVPIPKIPEESGDKTGQKAEPAKQDSSQQDPSQGGKMASAAMGLIRGLSLIHI